MKLISNSLAIALSFSLVIISFLCFSIQDVYAQDSRIALQRGYRTGYSDGYMSGYRDAIDNAAKSFDKHNEYTKADRAYLKDYGSLEDYRDGYRQGFESGYDTGFDKRSFDAVIPPNLSKRGTIPNTVAATNNVILEEKIPVTVNEEIVSETETQTEITAATNNQQTAENSESYETNNLENTSENTVSANTDDKNRIALTTRRENVGSLASGEMPIIIPTDTELIIEILDEIDTGKSKEGDKFQARVISPDELDGAIIEGRIIKIQKPGRIKRRSEISLSFDRIVLSQNRWSNFNATLTEVLPVKGDNVRRVDTEGTVEGKSSVKDDSVKIGATTGAGLIVGAVAGGPVGAVVGAGVGAAFGVGAVVVERGKHIRINRNQQLRIRSAYETQIR